MPELELRVQVLSINEGYNEGLKEQCRTLKEYMQYVDKVRGYVKEVPVSKMNRASSNMHNTGFSVISGNRK